MDIASGCDWGVRVDVAAGVSVGAGEAAGWFEPGVGEAVGAGGVGEGVREAAWPGVAVEMACAWVGLCA